MPLLEDVVEVAFRKGNRAMYYKTLFSDKWYNECDFLVSKFDVKSFPDLKNVDRGISQVKRDGIMQCLKGVPRSCLSFWNSLKINDESKDLAEHLID